MTYNTKTSCQKCTFALYNDTTQIGCQAKRLQYFSLLECYNEESEFFVTLDYPCNLYRTENWARDKQENERLQIAYKEIELHYTVITSSVDFEEKINKLNNQGITPKKIYCFLIGEKPSIIQNNIEYVKFIENVKSPIHKIIKRIRTATNILYLDQKDSINNGFMERLNSLVNIDMCRKTIFFSKKDSSFIMPSVYYRVYPMYTYIKILEELSSSLPEAIGYFEEI